MRLLCAIAILLGVVSLHAQSSSALDRAFADFWKADDIRSAERAGERIVKLGTDYDTVAARLKQGRPYGNERTGTIPMRWPAGAGVLFDNYIEVPDDYTPGRPWQVRVQLHGGVSRPPSVTVAGSGIEEERARQRRQSAVVTPQPPGQSHPR